jgi:sigma-E factor negative regulatory protein RseA
VRLVYTHQRNGEAITISVGAMAAAVAAVVWVARPFLIPESSTARVDQIASVSTPALANPVVVRDYVAAHRQLAGPAAVRQVSFGGTQ